MKVYRIVSWTSVVLWMGVIFYLSDQVAADSSELSSGVSAFIIGFLGTLIPAWHVEAESFSFFIRKAAHFSAYFLLGFLIVHAFWASHFRGVRFALYAFAASVFYAISDEVHQLFIPGRSGEVRDVFIDSAGALVGIGCFLILWRLFMHRRDA